MAWADVLSRASVGLLSLAGPSEVAQRAVDEFAEVGARDEFRAEVELRSQTSSVVMVENGVTTHPAVPCSIDLGEPVPEAVLAIARLLHGICAAQRGAQGLVGDCLESCGEVGQVQGWLKFRREAVGSAPRIGAVMPLVHVDTNAVHP